MPWYRAGTVTVTNGSAVVTGANTDFVANTQQGEAFLGPDGRVYEIATVVSATQIILGSTYQGAPAGGQGFAISPTSSFARDLALGAAQLLNRYAGVADGIGAGLFPDGAVATPAFRFAADQDTGIFRFGENQLGLVAGGVRRVGVTSAGLVVTGNTELYADEFPIVAYGRNGIGTWYSGGYLAGQNSWNLRLNGLAPVFTATSEGNIGVGTLAPAKKFVVSNAGGLGFEISPADQAGSPTLFAYNRQTSQYAQLSYLASPHVFYNGGTEALRIDTTGNILIGTTTNPQGRRLIVNGANSDAGFEVRSPGVRSMIVSQVDVEGWNSSATSTYLGKNNGTGRSLNAGGTINASGADYAEYMWKAAGCGLIAKGDVCGVDHDGSLTKTWADAVSFVVKSTDPSLVGGDTWDVAVGPKPEQPGAEPQEPAAPETLADDADEAAMAAYHDAVAGYPAQLAAYQSAHAEWTAATAAYADALPVWEAAHEMARQCVDRIAFCGQVPVNVTGDFSVGDYIIAAANGGGIKAIAVAEADITFDQYRRRIGKVWAVRDGRAWIDVQHG